MKILSLLTITALICASQTVMAKAKYVAADDSKETQLCISAATDSRNQFRHEVRKFGVYTGMASKIRMLSNKLYCNGENVATFAYQAGNDEVGDILNRYRKHSVTIRDIARVPFDGNVTGSF